MSKFGQNLKVCRDYFGNSQSKLAEKLNLTQSALSRYEGTDSNPGVITAFQIAQELGVSLDLLMSDQVDPKDIALDLLIADLRRTVREKGLTLGKIEALKILVKIAKEGI